MGAANGLLVGATDQTAVVSCYLHAWTCPRDQSIGNETLSLLLYVPPKKAYTIKSILSASLWDGWTLLKLSKSWQCQEEGGEKTALPSQYF